MSEENQARLEALLSDALRPIEPPEDLVSRVETTLTAITEQAAAELSSWAEVFSEDELEALRDPRNWVRPVAAVAAGTLAGGALVVVSMRRRRRPTGLRATAENVLRSVRPDYGPGPPELAAGAGRAPAGAGLAAPAARPTTPRIRCRMLSGVSIGKRPRIASPLPMMNPQSAATTYRSPKASA